MGAILIDSSASDAQRREMLYDGAIFFYTPRPAARELNSHAWEMIGEAFGSTDPMTAQDAMPVEQFVDLVAPLKPRFTHSVRAKELLRELLVEFGCDPEKTYFDLPKLRIVTHSGYLTAGVGYAYKPHRDVWYAAPMCQQNWWFPLVDIGPANSMAFHPQFWQTPVPNTSAGFDPYVWNATGRKDAAKFIHSDNRNHPAPKDPIPAEPQIRLVGQPSSMLLFSAAHLHSTVANTSGRTRFSVDFRTVTLDDLLSGRGAVNVDNESTGTTLRDFVRASDFAPVPEELVKRFDIGSQHEGTLVYQPTVG
jgi:hypothetical protein